MTEYRQIAVGAAFGTSKSGIGIAGLGPFKPELVMKVRISISKCSQVWFRDVSGTTVPYPSGYVWHYRRLWLGSISRHLWLESVFYLLIHKPYPLTFIWFETLQSNPQNTRCLLGLCISERGFLVVSQGWLRDTPLGMLAIPYVLLIELLYSGRRLMLSRV
jgi:hypothetical protein